MVQEDERRIMPPHRSPEPFGPNGSERRWRRWIIVAAALVGVLMWAAFGWL